MGASLSILVAGLMFGFGLAVSGMTHASKVLGFLDITGTGTRVYCSCSGAP